METTLTLEELLARRGDGVYSSENERIGKIEEIFVDQETDRPEWIGIGTGLFNTKRVLVPVHGARLEHDGFYVPYGKDAVKDSPDIDADAISEDTERGLYAYYGLAGPRRITRVTEPSGRPSTVR